MRSELFRIPMQLGEVPLFGAGVLLTLWALGAAFFLVGHYRKQGIDSDFWSMLLPFGISGAAILFAPRFVPDGIPIRGYGVMLLAAIITGLWMAVHRAREQGISADTIFSLSFLLFIFGIAGARIFFVIEYWETRYANQSLAAALLDVVKFTEGGLVVYGSLLGATGAFVYFCLRHQLSMLKMADILAPSLAAGLALGRIGCLLNGCCYGGACDLPWAITFPQDSPPYVDQLLAGKLHGLTFIQAENDEGMMLVTEEGVKKIESINGYQAENQMQVSAVLGAALGQEVGLTVVTSGGEVHKTEASSYERSLPIHPTQIYSAINAGLLAWLLWSFYPMRRWNGQVILLLLTIYPFSRFLLEIIRTDESAIFGTGLSISQNVSLLLLVPVVAGWYFLPRLSDATYIETQTEGTP